MNLRLCICALFGLLVCIACSGLEPSAALCGQKDAKDAKDSIVALFDGIPADVRSMVKENSVRRDRVNDWFREHVNGKGKITEIQINVKVTAERFLDGSYAVRFARGKVKGGVSGAFVKVNVLGDEWAVDLHDGMEGPEPSRRNNFGFVGVTMADAEKLVDLKHVTIQGKVQEAKLVPGAVPGGSISDPAFLTVVLGEIRVDGKKMTQRKRVPGYEAASPAK
jgi:hypothetical protein